MRSVTQFALVCVGVTRSYVTKINVCQREEGHLFVPKNLWWSRARDGGTSETLRTLICLQQQKKFSIYGKCEYAGDKT